MCAPPVHMAYTTGFQPKVHMCLTGPAVQEFCSLKYKSFLPLDVHNLSFIAITVKLMFLTNVYTDLISLQIISYMQILHLHLLPSAVPKRSENRQFSGRVHTISGTFRGFYAPGRYSNSGQHINRRKNKRMSFFKTYAIKQMHM